MHQNARAPGSIEEHKSMTASATAPVRCERRGAIALLTLAQPERLNPVSLPVQRALAAHLAQLGTDKAVRAVILTGEGRGFCAGADLSSVEGVDGSGSLGERAARMMRELSNPIILALRNLPVPVVAAVNGACAGGGVGVALAADIVIAARSAYFYLPFLPKLGIVPDLGASWFVERLLGRSRAMGLALLGERLSAEQAAANGLIWAAVDDAELMPRAFATAERLAALPSHAVREARAAFEAAARHTLAEQLDYEASRQRELLDLPSFGEGVRAFLAKREPRFHE
jgi:2-(1,2-epoxy-1,2-dihydrophenyl)acetyl-CoA isomerase